VVSIWKISRSHTSELYHSLIRNIPFFIFILFITIFSILLPRSAGPDEPTHNASAWFSVKHLTLPAENFSLQKDIPFNLLTGPCFIFNESRDNASCLPERTSSESLAESKVYNYSFPYYFTVGLGQHLFSYFSYKYIDLGGRIFSQGLMGLFVLMVWIRMKRYPQVERRWLFLSLTPTALFYMSVVNATGWEIIMSIFFSFFLFEHLQSKVLKSFSLSTFLKSFPLLLSSILLVTSRPLGLVWMAGITSIALLIFVDRGTLKQTALSVLPLLSPAVIVWILLAARNSSPMIALPGYVGLKDPTFANYSVWFVQSSELILDRLRQMIGVYGWGDISIPSTLFVVYMISTITWITVVFIREKISKKVLLILVLFVLLLPSIVEASFWNLWPAWWQGRYSLPMLSAFLFLIGLKARDNVRFHLLVSYNFNIFVVWFMFFVTYFRYSYGLQGYVPILDAKPAVPIHALGAAIVLLMLTSFLSLVDYNHFKSKGKNGCA
jgi:hypothetical protein